MLTGFLKPCDFERIIAPIFANWHARGELFLEGR